MAKKLFSKISILFFLTVPFLAYSQEECNGPKPQGHGLKLLPSAYYMPETRLGIGAFANNMFRICNLDTLSRSSSFQTYASYTLNKQYAIENEWLIFSRQEKFIFSGMLDYTRFPEFFFGIGNNTDYKNKEQYSFDLIHLSSKNLKCVKGKFYAGVQYDLQYLFRVLEYSPNMMNSKNIPGGKGYFTSGIGPLLMYDTRDNVLNAKKGNYAEFLFSMNERFTFSEYRYDNLVIDLRKYQTFFNRYTIALQGYGNFNFGTVPFRAMPAIGGARYLRGYYRGRFRDNNLIVLQGETRVQLFWRMGAVVFVGIAQVSDRIKNLSSNSFKYNYGGGLRFKINKHENINLRFDLGFTKEGYGLYIVFAEAF